MRCARHLAVVGLVVLVGVGTVAGARAARRPPAVRAHRVVPTTVIGRVLQHTRRDGTLSRQTALQAFAAVYGATPGVRLPHGSRVHTDAATGIAWTVLDYRPSLTAAQRKVVSRRLGVATAAPAARAHAAADVDGDPGFTEDAGIEKIVRGWASTEAAMVGDTKFPSMKVIAGNTSTAITGEYADTLVFNSAGNFGSGTPAICRVRIVPDGQGQTPEFKNLFLAHEAFHCVQGDLLGSKVWVKQPLWMLEGTADWVALTLDPVSYAVGGHNLTGYIKTPGTALFDRSTDAVGFFGHVQDQFGDLWSRMAKIVVAGSSIKEFAQATGFNAGFMTSWGSSPMRSAAGGPPWAMTSPIAPPNGVAFPAPTIPVSGPATVSTPQYTTALYKLSEPGDEPLIHLQITGFARLGPTANITDLKDRWVCTAADGCKCPPDTTGTPPPSTPVSDDPLVLALAGDFGKADGTTGDVTPHKLEEFCHAKTPPKSGAGVSNGDPYLTTFDQAGYGFQTAGEFTLVKSKTDDLEIQSRQQPYPTSFAAFHDTLALNTAFAMHVAGATVQVGAGAPLRVWVDKHLARPSTGQSISLTGGGTLIYHPDTVLVVWPDGSLARVFSIGREGVNIAIRLAASRARHVTGLLGNDDGNPRNDFVGRNGTRYSDGLLSGIGLFGGSRRAQRVAYHRFGPTWRITPRTSLFVYPPGRTTRSYLVRGFPHRFAWLNLLSRPERRAAAAVCRAAGVTGPLLAGCTLDVGATHRKAFATSDATVEQSLGNLAGGPLVSPIPWSELSSQPDTSTIIVPSATVIPGGIVVAAYQRSTDRTIEAATFGATAAGIGPVSRVVAVGPDPGGSGIGNPVLFAAFGGGLQMVFTLIEGTEIAQRNADGSFGAPVLSSPKVYTDDNGAVLASDGATPLWSAAQSGVLSVFRGATGAVQNDLSGLAPGGAFSPQLAFDTTGRLWVVWYALTSSDATSGVYVMQLDPATGAAVSAAMQAPNSNTGVNGIDPLAMACAQICRVVYDDATADRGRLLSWAPGDAAPTTVLEATTGSAVRQPAAAYTADGRLWVSWIDDTDRTLMAKLGDATGANGTAVALPQPAGFQAPLREVARTLGNLLVLTTDWQIVSSGQTAVWATAVTP